MSCLFNSLSKAVKISPDILRLKIVNYLETNPPLLDDIKANDIISWTEESNLEDYTLQMRRPDRWGGAIEIKAFCDLFKINVIVHVLYTNREFMIKCHSDSNVIIHINYTGSHYTFSHFQTN